MSLSKSNTKKKKKSMREPQNVTSFQEKLKKSEDEVLLGNLKLV